MNTPLTIPPMTHPLSKYWNQPDRNKIRLTDVRALMNKKTFDELMDYSHSSPTGMYTGKMWKAFGLGGWYLIWYEEHWTFVKQIYVYEES